MRKAALALAALAVIVTATPTAAAPASGVGTCSLFPGDNAWHRDISQLPVLAQSAQYVDAIGSDARVKADFGSGEWDGGPIGIPFDVVSGQAGTSVSFDYDDESDHVPYPIPADAHIEGGPSSDGDRHVLIVDNSSCTLYELYAAYPNGDGTWHAGSGAVWDLNSNALRPDSWTSADAAGLPILPGLVRYDEVASGHIDHAIRVTVPRSARSHLWPARHDAGRADDTLPPMGLRLRLRADFDTSPYAPQVQVILDAMKTYGVIVADNGSAWYISGAPDDRWDNDMLRELGDVHGADFQAVDASSLMVDPNSGATGQGVSAPPPSPETTQPVVDDNGVAGSPGLKDGLPVTGAPNGDGQLVPGKDGGTEAGVHGAEPGDVAAAQLGQQGAAGESEGAQAVEDGAIEPSSGGEGRVGVKGVAVAGESVDERLIAAGLVLGLVIGCALWRGRTRARRAAIAAPATLTPDESG